MAGADLAVTRGRPLAIETDERISSIEPAGVMATASRHRRPGATREAPAVIAVGDQLATRESRAGWGNGEARSIEEAG
jgi:hypothetical protein